MTQYEILSSFEPPELYCYLGRFPAFIVMEAYRSAFGSVQMLSYERDVLKYICERFNRSGEKEKMKFCDALGGLMTEPDRKTVRAAERTIKRKERKLKFRCMLDRLERFLGFERQ